jgi:hypothetical protein
MIRLRVEGQIERVRNHIAPSRLGGEERIVG